MVLEFVVSGAVGGGLTLLATWGEYYRRQQDRRERTRMALLTELRGMLEPIESWSEAIIEGPTEPLTDPPILEADPVITDVYDSRMPQIALFDADTVERVTMTYSVGKRLQRRLARVHETDEIDGARVFGLLGDVVQFHLFINLAIRQLEADHPETTELTWPTVDGEKIRAEDIREILLDEWAMEDVAIINFDLDYRVAPPTGDGTGDFDRLPQKEDVISGQ